MHNNKPHKGREIRITIKEHYNCIVTSLKTMWESSEISMITIMTCFQTNNSGFLCDGYLNYSYRDN